jgi:geranylgeranyl reductase family protein
MINTQVCIIGAGPAGTMAALRLAKEGIPFVILDKDTFPREKICGDALSGKVPHIIRRLSPDILQRLEERCKPLHSHGIRFVAPGGHVFDVPFIKDYDPKQHPVPGYTVKRELFDDFLIEEVRKVAGNNLMIGQKVLSAKSLNNGFIVTAEKEMINSRILIDASGAKQSFSTDYTKPQALPKKTALAVRAYYEGVSGFHARNFIELYFLEEALPGYFWIFPLPEGMVNVGLGIRKDVVVKKKIKLSALMEEIITSHPLVAPRFIGARKISNAAAYHLPLGNPRFRISGSSYMLAGDAAHLVDPLTGEGVGNALYSGYIAAEQAISCLKEGRFDDSFMKAYDKRIKRVLGKEMKISANFQSLLKFKNMVKLIAKKADGNKHIPGLMSSMFTDLDHRKKLLNPIFILRVLLNR